ncbi:hypothetical protein JHK82_050517 [Glycine max]|nr:hypothetical protein JHK82_050517 [Glycine max]
MVQTFLTGWTSEEVVVHLDTNPLGGSRKRVQRKSHTRVQLLSPIPKPPALSSPSMFAMPSPSTLTSSKTSNQLEERLFPSSPNRS